MSSPFYAPTGPTGGVHKKIHRIEFCNSCCFGHATYATDSTPTYVAYWTPYHRYATSTRVWTIHRHDGGHPIAVMVWTLRNDTSSSLFGHSTSATVWTRNPSNALDNLPSWWFGHDTSASHWAGIRSSPIRTFHNINISWGFYVPQRLYLSLNGKQAFPYWVNTSVTIPVRKVYVFRYTNGKLSIVKWNIAPLISTGTIKPTLDHKSRTKKM